MESNVAIKYNEKENLLYSEDFPFHLTMNKSDFNDDKDINRFIKTCERMIRISPEYKEWSSYIRDVMGLSKCAITEEDHGETSVEIHHHPYTLFTLTQGILAKELENNNEVNSFTVAKNVMELHYKMQAPFCLLVKSLHDKYHNGFLQIPCEIIQGDKHFFLKNYGHYLDEDDLERINARFRINKDNCGWKMKWIDSSGENDD